MSSKGSGHFNETYFCSDSEFCEQVAKEAPPPPDLDIHISFLLIHGPERNSSKILRLSNTVCYFLFFCRALPTLTLYIICNLKTDSPVHH